jgi:hypothetical protein
MDDLFEKIKNDETGKLADIMKELFYLSKEAAGQGVDIDELASVCTMGWQSDKMKEMAQMFEFMIQSNKK